MRMSPTALMPMTTATVAVPRSRGPRTEGENPMVRHRVGSKVKTLNSFQARRTTSRAAVPKPPMVARSALVRVEALPNM